MATTLLSVGYAQTMPQNQVHALPASRCLLFTSTAGAAFQQSNDVAFGDNTAVVLTNGQAELAGGFLRSTAGAAVVTLKKL